MKEFDKTVEANDMLLFKDKIDTNQIKLFFCTGKFGYQNATLLIVKSGLKVFLNYTAKIKRDGRDYFEITSVEPLIPNVKSLEAATW